MTNPRGNAPAYPGPMHSSHTGLTVREYLTAHAMEGLLAGVECLDELDLETRETTALLACAMADAQLAALAGGHMDDSDDLPTVKYGGEEGNS